MMTKEKMIRAGITFIGAAAASAATVAAIPHAEAACSCLAGTSIYKALGKDAMFPVSSGIYSTVLTSDTLYGFKSNTAPYVSMSYNGGSVSETVSGQICKWNWQGTSSTCGASHSQTGLGAKLVIPGVSGVHNFANSVWDRYLLTITGPTGWTPGAVQQISAQMPSCW